MVASRIRQLFGAVINEAKRQSFQKLICRPHWNPPLLGLGARLHIWASIHRDDGRTGAFAFDQSTAVGLAVREAQFDHAQGSDVIVCGEQKDGTFKQEWASPWQSPK
jgi:hypothetical protein